MWAMCSIVSICHGRKEQIDNQELSQEKADQEFMCST